MKDLWKKFKQWKKKVTGFQFWLGCILLILILCVFDITRHIILTLIGLGVVIYFFWSYVLRTEDKVRTTLRLILVPLLGLGVFYYLFHDVQVLTPPVFLQMTAVISIFGIIWLAPLIAEKMGDLFTNLLFGFGGGTGKVEKTFMNSIPEGYRKRGMFKEALDNIEDQLGGLVDNFDGNLLKAEIYAEDLHDFPTAEAIIQQMLGFDGLNPKLSVMLYNRLADWQLKLCKSLGGAKAALQQIVDRFPDSEEALYAFQRINRLRLANEGAPEAKQVVRIVEDFGLKKDFQGWEMPVIHWQEEMRELIDYLTNHPKDWDAREKLSTIYSHECKDVQKAVSQLEILLGIDGQPRKKVAQWLNMEADYYICDHDLAGARRALERIGELYPDSAPAHLAQNRIALLAKELEKEAPETLPVPKTDPNLQKDNKKHFVKAVRDTIQKRSGEALPEKKGNGYVIVGGPSSGQSEEPVAAEKNSENSGWIKDLERYNIILERDPMDYEANEEVAAIYAYKMGESEAGIAQLNMLIDTPNQPAAKVALWLNRQADFYVHDRSLPPAVRIERAKAALTRIKDLLPCTPFVPQAQRRMQYLKLELSKDPAKKVNITTSDSIVFSGDRIVKAVRQTREKRAAKAAALAGESPETIQEKRDIAPVQEKPALKLKEELPPEEKPDTSWIEEMARLENELIVHPQNQEAREQLATIYAYKEGETEIAIAQLEILIAMPMQSPRRVAQLLHREADFYIQAKDMNAAKEALERIELLYPGHPLVTIAKNRITRLKIELGKVK